MDMSQFWEAVRAREAGIAEEYPYIVSIDGSRPGMRGGVVTQVSRRAAAQRLVEGTHLLATPAQVEVQRRHEAVAAALEPGEAKPGPVLYVTRK